MSNAPILRAIDAVTVPVPDLDQGLAYYRDQLGHEVIWRNDDRGQVALRLPDSNAELVLTTHHDYEANWLVNSVPQAVAAMVSSGGRIVVEERLIPVGRLAVVADPSATARPARPVRGNLRHRSGPERRRSRVTRGQRHRVTTP